MFNLVMTGTQIKNVLEDAINFYLDPSGSWGAYPRTSGLRFDVNEAKPFGHRVSNLEVNERLAGDWTALDMDKRYTVVTNNYIATPRDGYYEFGNIAAEDREDTYVEYAQSFIEYAESVGVLEPVSSDRYSTQNWSDSTPAPTPAPQTSGSEPNKVSLVSVSIILAVSNFVFFGISS